MAVSYTKLTLTQDVAFEINCEWREMIDDPKAYNITYDDYDHLYLKPLKVNGGTVTLPYTEGKQVCNDVVRKVILKALDETSSARHTNVRKKLAHWVKTGDYRLPVKKKKVPSSNKPAITPIVQRELIIMFDRLIHECITAAATFVGESYAKELSKRIDVTYTFSHYFYKSRGGRKKDGIPFMRFALARDALLLQEGCEEFTYNEYASIKSDPTIGSCKGSLEVFCSTLVAHELAHVIQFHAPTRYPRSRELCGISVNALKKTHGEGWKTIYKRLRELTTNKLDSYQFIG